MPGLLSEAKKLFGSDNLYDVLGISSTATKAEVKKAYYKLSLTVHPDRVEKNKELSTKKFQVLGKIYVILSDNEKRTTYDETGCVDDEMVANLDKDWNDYWRVLFPKFDLNDIEKFEATYKGSEEELETIKSAYLKHKGDIGKILDSVMCATIKDEPRIRSMINNLITSKELPEFEAFTNEPTEKKEARKRKAKIEEKNAEVALKKMKSDTKNDLQAVILRNQKSRQETSDDFFKQVEEKYGKSKSSSTSGKKSKKTSK